MDLRDAVQQYVDMVALGSQALLRLVDQRLADQRLVGEHNEVPVLEDVAALISEIAQTAERLPPLARNA